MNSHEKFRNITAGIQSLFLSLAIAIGGAWAAYRFALLEDVVSLDIAIEAQQITSPHSESPTLLVEVSISNKGSRHITLDLKHDPLLIQRITRHDTKELIAARSWRPQVYWDLDDDQRFYRSLTTQSAQPGTTKIISFVQELDGPGLYFIRFSVPANNSISSDMIGPFYNPVPQQTLLSINSWSSTTYITVGEPGQLNPP